MTGATTDGPPTLFPPMARLPPPPELTERDEQLLKYRRHLQSAWRNSCYFLDEEPEEKKYPETVIEHHRDRVAKAAKSQAAERAKLSQLLTLNARYFPVELHGRGRGAARRKRRREEDDDPSIWRVHEGHATQDISRLDRLARLERTLELEEEAAAEKAGAEDKTGAERRPARRITRVRDPTRIKTRGVVRRATIEAMRRRTTAPRWTTNGTTRTITNEGGAFDDDDVVRRRFRRRRRRRGRVLLTPRVVARGCSAWGHSKREVREPCERSAREGRA